MMARNPCARCGAEAHDLFICEQCGEMVCANCLAETGTDQTICEDCPTKLSEVERLREALAIYGKHKNNCILVTSSREPEPCTCGLAQALAGQPEPATEKPAE